MELRTNMYVRTIKGKIARIDEVNEETGSGIVCHDYWYESFPTNENFELYKENLVKKASFNIIDLIEVGDYVNGYKVSLKGYDYAHFVQCDYPVENGTTNHYKFYKQAIKSIVTKEQFKSSEYVVE